MKIYLINSQYGLLGYTYDKIAVKALLSMTINSFELEVIVKDIDQDILPANVSIKTKKHLENLSAYYKNLGYEFYSWKLIQFNREIIPTFKYTFYKKFQEVYSDILMLDIYKSIDDIMNNKTNH